MKSAIKFNHRLGSNQIEAIRVELENHNQIEQFLGNNLVAFAVREGNVSYKFITKFGITTVSTFDFIVKLRDGSFIPFDQDQFLDSHDAVCERWIPKIGELYWCIDSYMRMAVIVRCDGSKLDKTRQEQGNCFQHKAIAEDVLADISTFMKVTFNGNSEERGK